MTPLGSVAIIAHDAGGAEILSSWIRRNPRRCMLVLGGPAKDIFQRKVPHLSVAKLDAAIKECDWVLTGTGAGRLEFDGMMMAKANSRYVVSFLDHWSVYRDRFLRNGLQARPDEIWVGDKDALTLVEHQIPETKSILVPNPYWLDSLESFSKITPKKISTNVLYVSTNIDVLNIAKKLQISDESALKKIAHFLGNFEDLRGIESLTIRRHPSESPEKYRQFRYSGLVIHDDSDSSLVESISKHSHVIGLDSMAQVIGKLCGKWIINVEIEGVVGGVPEKYIDSVFQLSWADMA